MRERLVGKLLARGKSGRTYMKLYLSARSLAERSIQMQLRARSKS